MYGTVVKNPILALFLGGGEIFLIAALVIILFGFKRLPSLLRGLGQGFRDFRKALDQVTFDAGRSLGGIHGKPAAEALTPDNQTAELYDPAALNKEEVRCANGEPANLPILPRNPLKFTFSATLICAGLIVLATTALHFLNEREPRHGLKFFWLWSVAIGVAIAMIWYGLIRLRSKRPPL